VSEHANLRQPARCGTTRRLKAKRAPLGKKAPKRAACRYASIWLCHGEGHYARRMAIS
jgi:hypothetical protein